jgi:hypothetical protein
VIASFYCGPCPHLTNQLLVELGIGSLGGGDILLDRALCANSGDDKPTHTLSTFFIGTPCGALH